MVRHRLDDQWRVAFSSIESNELAVGGCKTLIKALRCYHNLGSRLTFTRVLTDRGACYWSTQATGVRSRLGASVSWREFAIKHLQGVCLFRANQTDDHIVACRLAMPQGSRQYERAVFHELHTPYADTVRK